MSAEWRVAYSSGKPLSMVVRAFDAFVHREVKMLSRDQLPRWIPPGFARLSRR